MDPILSMLLTLLGYVWAACGGTSSPANAAGIGEVCLYNSEKYIVKYKT